MKTINVVAAVFRKDSLTFVAKRRSNSFDGMWEFPGGKIDGNETASEALIRELKEEMCIEAKTGKEICTTIVHPKEGLEIKVTFIECESNFNGVVLNNHYESKWIASQNDVSPWAPGDIPALSKIFLK